MKILSGTDPTRGSPKGTVLTIGNFDGVHRGHQAILKSARQTAEQLRVSLTVMTFDPHPATVLHPDRAPGVLTPLPLKAHLLESFKVDTLIVIQDSLKLLNLSPKEFVDTFLMAHLAPKALVEGPNFTFGYGRSGTIETLRKLGEQRDFDVIEVPFTQIQLSGHSRLLNCSSSLVRDYLDKGQVFNAGEILSRPYRLLGKTIPGRGIGKTLGFPTANLGPSGQIIPSEGVYAGRVLVADTLEQVCRGPAERPAALSIGRAKTFVTDHPLLLEAHLLESEVEDLTGKYMAMDFIQWIRGQQRFESRQALIDQIGRDCQKAREILSV
jgi:riboflavin kinase/FMN adenylyltransferase